MRLCSPARFPKTTRALATLGGITLLAGQASLKGFTPPVYRRELLLETYKIGVQSLVLVLFTGLFTGMVLALQLAVQLQVFGATSLVVAFVSTAALRELGPVLTALVVAGRAGVTGVLKPLCFGALIALLGCSMGLHTGHSAAGVGAATTRTVVRCSMLIILSDFVLTKVFVAVGWIAPVG